MARELKDGEKIRLKGSAGALFLVTVGQPFTRELIEARLARGEWSWPGDSQPEAESEPEAKPKPPAKTEPTSSPESEEAPVPAATPDPGRPAVNAPKSEWVQYAARTQHMSLEDAANYTKADLVDMTS